MADGVQIEGVDYAGSHPDPAALRASGRVFACRYGGPGGDWKHLTPDEAARLSAAGVSIVANAEGAADGLLGGRSAGETWARQAEAHFVRCGMPEGRPIYLSVDFDVTASQWPAVAASLRGAANVLGAARVGVYGGRRAIEWARRDGVAAWFWQTYAWSGGKWVPGNHIEQYRNGVSLAGATLDLDRALMGDFGQWTTGGDMELTDTLKSRNNHPGRNVDNALTDVANLRDWMIGSGVAYPPQPANYPAPGSPGDHLARLPQLLAEHAAAPIDVEALAAALAPLLAPVAEAAAERAVRRVLGKLDEAGS